MKLAFLVNDVATEVDEYTTTRLARAAVQGGHEVCYIGVGDVELGESDGQLVGRARAALLHGDDRLDSFMERIKVADAERIAMDELDALYLRNESIDDLQERPWASPLGVVFGQMLKARGVTVVNDPMSLVRATSKLYLEEFPDKIRPRSLVTRDPEAIERFVAAVGHCVVRVTSFSFTRSSLRAARMVMPAYSCWRDASSSGTGSRPPSGGCPRVTTPAPTSARVVAPSLSTSVSERSASSTR